MVLPSIDPLIAGGVVATTAQTEESLEEILVKSPSLLANGLKLDASKNLAKRSSF
jgi:hypothetical protein